jgi:hypothetical protein
MVYKKEELKNKTIMDNNIDNNSSNNKEPDNKDKAKDKNNIGSDDFYWKVDEKTIYYRKRVLESPRKNYFYTIDFKSFEHLDPITLEKFKIAAKIRDNVKFIYQKNKQTKLVLVELKIGQFDGRMVAKTMLEKTENEQKFNLIVFNEISDHQKIRKDRQKRNVILQIDVSDNKK